MTLVLATVNGHEAVMVADGQVSEGSVPSDREHVKLTIVMFEDATLAMGFTGLATVGVVRGHRGPAPAGAYRTVEWVADQLVAAADPDHLMIPTLVRLKDRLSARYPPVTVQASDALLVLGFVGFRYDEQGTHRIASTLGNSEPTADGKLRAGQEFDLAIEHVQAASILALGRPAALVESSRLQLADLVSSRAPGQAIAAKAVEVIREAARSPAAGSAVGDMCMSLIIPSDRSQPIRTSHHADRPGSLYYLAHVVDLRLGPNAGVYMDVVIKGGLPQGPFRDIVFPKVPRNAPCSCGSGKKYRACHGRPMRAPKGVQPTIVLGPYRLPLGPTSRDETDP